MKHSIKQMLLTVLVALVSVSVSAYDFEVDGIYYNVLSQSDLTCEVTYGGTSKYSTSLYTGNATAIPFSVTYEGSTLSVTSIGEYAFSGCKSLASVVIPNSVTSIGDDAFFGCTSLTSVDIPNSVTNIGRFAFHYCTSLASVDIPNSVTHIGRRAFENCTGLMSVTIPNSVTSIESGVFKNCI